ncbi:hypothetical protein BJ875DRAFT_380444 [Amylocarpus encephaloides]|uniref:Uncharacterized protein n=1 Tax=Amylocarpus encephaloides TaxID=45428 RepID=A0A9P7YGD5_9HELO|nr:hypothetical protein BJ875DRAFT_380444 [Amylocarpus encephaloides]
MPFPNLVPASSPEDEMDDLDLGNASEEADESVIEVAMSQVASRMKSVNTPAVEKAAAMEELDGGGFFDSDPDTPPAGEQPEILLEERKASDTSRNTPQTNLENDKPTQPQPSPESSSLPTPWHAGPKQVHLQPAEPQSSLTGVLDSSRIRSRSSGADGIKRYLPKGLPSMTQVGNFLGTSSTSASAKSPSLFGEMRSNRASTMFSSASPRMESSPQRPTYQPIIATRSHLCAIKQPPKDVGRPKSIRRVTSDDSLLYHSLSRASSLGDDTRFEQQKEQVNSRAKAIKDSLQDRSSFRLPQMPNMPSMKSISTMPSMPSMPRVPSFNFNMNFLNANAVPARKRTDTDLVSDFLAGNVNKRRPSALPNPVGASGMIGASVSQPRAAITPREAIDGQTLSPFDRALQSLTGDIVVMGGYRGSILRSTKTNRQVWVPVKVGLNIRKVDLEVGLEPEDEDRMDETIYPSGMLTHIGPVDISKRLLKRLNECENAKNGELRVWNYGYDWRLSPHLLARKLTKFLENLPCNQPSKDGSAQWSPGATVIAHSLGGLITRHVVNHRPEFFAGVVYAGVPQSCINILGPLRNGDAVLLSSRILTAQVNFTLRTSFVLLPEDGECFVDIRTKERYPVDFFNIDDWIKYRLSPCTDPPLPPYNPPPPGGLGSLLNMSSSLLSLPNSGKRANSGPNSPSIGSFPDSPLGSTTPTSPSPPTKASRAADVIRNAENGNDRALIPMIGNNTNPISKGQNLNSSASTAVTIPRDKAIAYLKRTLAETKRFKQELYFRPELSESNRYPPFALIYGKSIPTCCGAKVDGLESIPCSDVYDNLAFASGDGVCLAKQAMLPEGYKAVNGGRIRSDRGHVTLLGDLNAVGRALDVIGRGRVKGIGLGVVDETTDV